MAAKKPEDEDIKDLVVAELKGISKQGFDHPSTQPALIGAALGIIIGTVLFDTSVGFVLGGVIGALIAIYLRVKA